MTIRAPCCGLLSAAKINLSGLPQDMLQWKRFLPITSATRNQALLIKVFDVAELPL